METVYITLGTISPKISTPEIDISSNDKVRYSINATETVVDDKDGYLDWDCSYSLEDGTDQLWSQEDAV